MKLVVLHFCSYCQLSSLHDQHEGYGQEIRYPVIQEWPLTRAPHWRSRHVRIPWSVLFNNRFGCHVQCTIVKPTKEK